MSGDVQRENKAVTERDAAVVDEEFGITLDPCEHPSIYGRTCLVCDQEVPGGS